VGLLETSAVSAPDLLVPDEGRHLNAPLVDGQALGDRHAPAEGSAAPNVTRASTRGR